MKGEDGLSYTFRGVNKDLSGIVPDEWMAFGGAILLAVGNGLMWASVVALLSKTAGEHQGAVQGLADSVGAFASIVGLILGGIMYAHLHGWLFILSAGLIFVVVFFALRLPREKTETGSGP